MSFDQSLRPVVPEPRIFPPFDAIPAVKWDRPAAERKGIFGFDSRDIRSRPFNLLRSRILKLAESDGLRSFGIVSATPGAGKSFVSSNLAAALSRTPDLDVYLIDFDLRRSSVIQNFSANCDVGLEQYLAGDVATLAPIAKRLDGERLVLVPSFRGDAPSAELLAGQPMAILSEALRQLPASAVCICDLPPAFASDDAAIVAAKLDAYLLVIEDGRTTQKQIRDTTNILAPAVCAGAVLNRYHGGVIGDDYGYGYGHGGKYDQYYS